VALTTLAGAASASATTITVNTTTDPSGAGCTGGVCSLRQAVNAAGAGDAISVPAGTYDVGSSMIGAMTVAQNISIVGAGASATVIDGVGMTMIFVVNSTASISGVTLRNGWTSNRGGAILVGSTGNLTLTGDVLSNNFAGLTGGAIEDHGMVTIVGSTLTSNFTGPTGRGAGINAEDVLMAKTLNVVQSTLSGNHAGSAGGGAIGSIGGTALRVTVTQSLFSGNTTTGSGAAILANHQPAQISDSTFTGNTSTGNGGAISDQQGGSTLANDTIATNSAGGSGGDLDASAGVPAPTLRNTIVAGGVAPSGANCNASVTSGGHNLEDANTCGLAGSGDLPSTPPGLGPTQNNGGPTLTRALLAGSAAINAGSNSGCPSFDQRGVARPQGLVCDIGAYELAPPNATTSAASSVGTSGATLNGTAGNPDAVGGSVFFQYGSTANAYGTTTNSQAIAAGAATTGFAAATTGLTPGKTYHYRVVATNSDGTAYGADRTFTTALPSNRFSIGKHKVGKHGEITIKLKAPDAGVFKAKGTFKVKVRRHGKRVTLKFTYGTGSVRAKKAGNVTLTIKISGKAKAELALIGKTTVSVAIKFTPTGGKTRQKTVKVGVRRSRSGKFS
jgi:CSLREA domain-containing protein